MRVRFWLRSFYDLTDIGIHRVRASEAHLCEYVFRVTRDTGRTLDPPRGRPNIRKLHDDGPLRHLGHLIGIGSVRRNLQNWVVVRTVEEDSGTTVQEEPRRIQALAICLPGTLAADGRCTACLHDRDC